MRSGGGGAPRAAGAPAGGGGGAPPPPPPPPPGGGGGGPGAGGGVRGRGWGGWLGAHERLMPPALYLCPFAGGFLVSGAHLAAAR